MLRKELERGSHHQHLASARPQPDARHTLFDDDDEEDDLGYDDDFQEDQSDDSSSNDNNTRRRYGLDEDVTVLDEGQEAMLIEDLQLKMTMMDEDDDDDINIDRAQDGPLDSNDSNAQDKLPAQRNNLNKPRRKVQQVLLVPNTGDLLLERYRQAARRSKKARALLDRALNWEMTVAHRDRLARDAFTEAGKARLLVEPKNNETTPELIAMLTDAKVKGEEEACRAADYKVTQLIPAVQVPAVNSGTVIGSRDNSKLALYRPPSIQCEDEASTATKAKTKDPAFQCLNAFHPHTSNFSGSYLYYDDYEDDDNTAEEHVFRAKQYLEFILPDLGDVRDDDSMAPKAPSRSSVLHSYHNQGSSGSSSTDDGGSGLGEISTLGYDESHSFDNLSSKDTIDHSNNDVFSMSSLNEIMDAPLEDFVPDRIMNMSSMKRKKLTIRMSFGGGKSTTKHEEKEDTTDEHRNSTAASPVKVTEEDKTEEEAMAKISSEVEVSKASTEVPTPTKQEKKFKALNFVKNIATAVHHHQHQHQSQSEDDNHATTSGGFLRRFRHTKKKVEKDNNTDNLRIIAPVLSDLSDIQSKNSSSNNVAADRDNDNDESYPNGYNAENTTEKGVSAGVPAVATPLAGGQLLPWISMGSSNQRGDDEEDRYTIDAGLEDDVENQTGQESFSPPLVALTPLSTVSIENTHSRYSPINSAGHDNVLAQGIVVHPQREDTCPQENTNLDADSADDTKENESLVTSPTVSTSAGGARKNKKKRRSLLGMFHRKEGTPDTTDRNANGALQDTTSDPKEKSSPSQKLPRISKPLKKVKSPEKKAPKGQSTKPPSKSNARARSVSKDKNNTVRDHASSLANTAKGNKKSSLQTALQLQETVEIMELDALIGKGAGKSTASSVLDSKKSTVSHAGKNTQRKKVTANQADGVKSERKPKEETKKKKTDKEKARKNAKPPTGTTPTRTERGKTKRRIDNNRPKSAKKITAAKQDAPKKAASAQRGTGGLQATRWVNSHFGFPKNIDPCSHAKTPRTGNSTGTTKKVNESPVPVDQSKMLNCDAAEVELRYDESSMPSNPLLPYQLIKLLEQSKIAADGAGAKEAAEKSIMKAMASSIRSELPSVEGAPPCEKENGCDPDTRATNLLSPSAAGSTRSKVIDKPTHSARGDPRAILILGESPRALGVNNAPFRNNSDSHHHRRPDADGLNARTKDVREVLGLADPDNFGEERSRSYLSRITEGTYRQDFDLPDP